MPLYVYECKKCGAQQEELQKLNDPAPDVCDACQAKGSLEKVLGVSNFQLKGGGWAKDGYA